jgi:hypothetical protein
VDLESELRRLPVTAWGKQFCNLLLYPGKYEIAYNFHREVLHKATGLNAHFGKFNANHNAIPNR